MQGNASSNSLPHCTANIIDDIDSPRKSNPFCFAAFADKHTGTLYNNLCFPSSPLRAMSASSCCMYHYKTNTILALPINGFSNKIIFVAYKQQYEMLESKGHIIRLNVMDNQARLVEPHNHHVNAAERAIQTIKDHQFACHNRQQFPTPVVGQTCTASQKYPEYDLPIGYQSQYVGV
jgi:hypothetical protein